jgi:uncharacterized FlaG/YvyC family protein
MNSIDTRTAIGGIPGCIGAKSQSDSHPTKQPFRDTRTSSLPDPTHVSFSTYGSRNEHLAVVVTNRETGEVIREVPSKEMQKLHVQLEVFV